MMDESLVVRGHTEEASQLLTAVGHLDSVDDLNFGRVNADAVLRDAMSKVDYLIIGELTLWDVQLQVTVDD
jgi:hypothetical protein